MNRVNLRVVPALSAAVGFLILEGCGGGSGATASDPGFTPVVPGAAGGPSVAALVSVDVLNGTVSVVPQVSGSDSRAVFAGTAVTYNTSNLFTLPGSPGVKTVDVSLTNNFGAPIGVDPSGLVTGSRVVFSPFTVTQSPVDLRSMTTVSTLAGSGAAGFVDGPALSATLTNVAGCASAPDGTVFFTDKQFVRKLSGGRVTTLAGGAAAGTDGVGSSAGFLTCSGIALNPADGSLVVADQAGSIRRVTQAGLVTTIGGNGTLGHVDGLGNVARFDTPTGVAVTPAGVLFVSDFGGKFLRKITLTGSPLTAAGYTVSPVAGTGVAGSADGPGLSSTFGGPAGLALTPDGLLYVADRTSNKIRQFDPVSGFVKTVAGTGVGSSVNGAGNIATFNGPYGLAAVKGALYITEVSGQQVRQLTLNPGGNLGLASSWTVQALAGTGAAGFVDGRGNTAQFSSPQLLASDASGALVVPDLGNRRIRSVRPNNGFFPLGIQTTAPPSGLVALSNPSGFMAANAFFGPQATDSPFIAYSGSLGVGSTSTPQNWQFRIPTGATGAFARCGPTTGSSR